MDISDDDLPFWFPSPLEDLGANLRMSKYRDEEIEFPYPRED